MSRKKRNFRPNYRDNYWQTEAYNQNLFYMLRDDITQLALSRFKWVNLPETCDARYLEWTLLYEGAATIAFPVRDPSKIMSLKMVQQGEPNCYDNPRSWDAIGATGRTRFRCTWSNGVVVFDNVTRYPLIQKINLWARELADIIRCKQVNRFSVKMPVIISGASESGFDMANLLKQISNGEPAVIATNGIDNVDVRVWNTDVPFLGKELTAEYENTWNIIYKELGIDSLPFKAERRIEDEVTDTMQPTELAALSPLDCRRSAAAKFCARFGEYLPEGPFYPVFNRDNVSDNYNIAHRFDTVMGVDDD